MDDSLSPGDMQEVRVDIPDNVGTNKNSDIIGGNEEIVVTDITKHYNEQYLQFNIYLYASPRKTFQEHYQSQS